MPAFSQTSTDRLATCDERLQRLFRRVVERFDCTILTGHRTEAEQNEAYANGLSKAKYPQSAHNSYPSRAVDVAPYPIDWEDRERFTMFAGYVMGIANEMGIGIRWGGDWNMNMQVSDNGFDDLPHFELTE